MSHGPKPDPRPDPREELAGVLSAADRPAAALQALRWAFVWSLEVLQEMSADPGEAFAVTVELDEALRQGEELGRVLPAVLAVAEPGSRVEADLRDRQRQLAQKRAEVAELLRHVEERARDEEELRARILEIQELAGRVRELERLDRLSQGLDELRAHRDQLEARLKGLADEANAEEDALAFAAARFIRLSEDRLADLRSSTQMLLDRATAKQKELAEAVRNKRQGTEELSSETRRLEEELRETTEHYQRLEAERASLFETVERYAEADRQMVKALEEVSGLPVGEHLRPGVEWANRALDQVDRQLRAIDEAIGRALEEHGRILRRERRVRRLGGD